MHGKNAVVLSKLLLSAVDFIGIHFVNSMVRTLDSPWDLVFLFVRVEQHNFLSYRHHCVSVDYMNHVRWERRILLFKESLNSLDISSLILKKQTNKQTLNCKTCERKM